MLEAPSKDSIPNPRRPSNPFNSKSEPDWVVVPKPTVTEIESNPRLQNGKHIMGQNGMHTHQSTVKQTPQSTPTIKAQNLASEHGQTRRDLTSSPRPLLGSGITRKPAPPIPPKPPVLTGSNGESADLNIIPSSVPAKQSVPIRRTGEIKPLESGRPTLNPIPTSQRPLNVIALASTLTTDHTQNQEIQGGAKLPPVPSNRASSARRPVPIGLLDKDDEGACLIQPIQPIRRQP